MIPAERMEEITELLYKKKSVSIKDIAKKIYASPSTIRRDLIDLEKAGVLRRTHGGATLVSTNTSEFSSFIRSQENKDKKQLIAKLAANFLDNDLSIFMDSSSTVHFLCDHMSEFKNIVIITNSIFIPNTLLNHDDIHVFCSGGVLKPHSHSLIGEMSYSFLKNYTPEISFISCKAIDPSGLYEADYQQIKTKEIMLENAKKKILLVDSSKFSKKAFINISSLENIDYIITDKLPNNFNSYSEENKKKFIYPKDEE